MLMRLLAGAAIASVIMIFIASEEAPAQESDPASNQRAVLVTGASTGIGRKITEVLAANGHFVYAGARKQSDLDALNQIENVRSIRLDVTLQEEIDAAVETIHNGGRGLHGLVNNAGVFLGGPLTEVTEEELKWMFDVNVFGVYRVTQAFAPLIIESKGRITTIGSISGVLSYPMFTQYSMSKHAVEAFTDGLAEELERFDVQVSIIEPGNYISKVGETALRRMAEKSYANSESPYAEDFEEFLAWSANHTNRERYKEPDEVAEAAVHALFDDDPKRRYMVVPSAEEAGWTIGKAVEELVQLNEWQAYSYSREELIAVLDKAMAGEN